jgi:hypothetical protein
VTRLVLFASIALCAASLALGFAIAGQPVFSLLVVVFGMAWFYAQWRGLEWFSMTGLGFAVLAAAVGALLHVAPGWTFSGASFSLFAWDLIAFRERLQFASDESDASAMEKSHLLRLGILAACGTALVSLPAFVHLQLGLWQLIFLVFVLAFGIAWLLWRLRLGR